MCHSESLSTKKSQIWVLILNTFFLFELITFMSADIIVLASVFALIFVIGLCAVFFTKYFRGITLIYIVVIGSMIMLQCVLLAYAFNYPDQIKSEADAEFKDNMHRLKQSLRTKSGSELIAECEDYKYAATVYKCCDFSSEMLRDACCPRSDADLPSCAYSYFAVNFWMMTVYMIMVIMIKILIVAIVAIVRARNKRYFVRKYQELTDIKLKSGFNAL